VRSRNKAKLIRRRAVLDGTDAASHTMIQQRTWKVKNLASPLVRYFMFCLRSSYIHINVLKFAVTTGCRIGDDDDKIRLNQRKPSKYKGLSRFGPEKNLQRINKFMKERPTFYKKLIQMKENFRFYLRCFYCITKVVILQFNSEKQDRISS